MSIRSYVNNDIFFQDNAIHGVNWEWSSVLPYVVNDIVVYNGSLYRCTTAVTSPTIEESEEISTAISEGTGDNEGKFVVPFYYIPDFATQGIFTDQVYDTYADAVAALGYTVNDNPITAFGSWESIGGAGGGLATWAATGRYENNDIVAHEGELYRFVTDNTTFVNTATNPQASIDAGGDNWVELTGERSVRISSPFFYDTGSDTTTLNKVLETRVYTDATRTTEVTSLQQYASTTTLYYVVSLTTPFSNEGYFETDPTFTFSQSNSALTATTTYLSGSGTDLGAFGSGVKMIMYAITISTQSADNVSITGNLTVRHPTYTAQTIRISSTFQVTARDPSFETNLETIFPDAGVSVLNMPSAGQGTALSITNGVGYADGSTVTIDVNGNQSTTTLNSGAAAATLSYNELISPVYANGEYQAENTITLDTDVVTQTFNLYLPFYVFTGVAYEDVLTRTPSTTDPFLVGNTASFIANPGYSTGYEFPNNITEAGKIVLLIPTGAIPNPQNGLVITATPTSGPILNLTSLYAGQTTATVNTVFSNTGSQTITYDRYILGTLAEGFEVKFKVLYLNS